MRPAGNHSTRPPSPSNLTTNGAHGPNGHSSTMAKAITNGHSGNNSDQNGNSSTTVSNGRLSIKRFSPKWHEHSREEVSRLMIQALQDLGYANSANSLIKESGCEVETANVAEFKNAILQGRWDDAELLILGPDAYSGEPHSEWVAKSNRLRERVPKWQGKGLALLESANHVEMLFWIRQQKYLELLEARDLSSALITLRQQLTRHSQSLNMDRLHFLGGLLMCASAEDLREQAKWNGASGSSRRDLLADLSRMISPKVMIPDNRLSDLLHQVKNGWINECQYHNTFDSPSLFADHECDREIFPDRLVRTISEHNDEIWFICFSNDGRKLATAGKDKKCIIYDVDNNFKVMHRFSDHGAGVCYVAWSPDDTKIITCTREPDNSLRIWDVETGDLGSHLHHFDSPPTAVAWLPDGEEYLVGSIDKSRALEIFNIYEESRYLFPTSSNRERIYDLALSPDGERLLAMGETKVYVYDFPSREQIGEWTVVAELKMTSITISKDSRKALVSINPSRIHLIDIETGQLEQVYDSHKQERVIIRSAFGGATGSFVLSGSEDSQIFVWRTRDSRLLRVFPGHGTQATKGCVNAVAWHPTNPAYFASAGDDGQVKLWASEQYERDQEGH